MIRRFLFIILWIIWGIPGILSIVLAAIILCFVAIIFWILGIEYDYECDGMEIWGVMMGNYCDFVFDLPLKITKAKNACDL